MKKRNDYNTLLCLSHIYCHYGLFRKCFVTKIARENEMRMKKKQVNKITKVNKTTMNKHHAVIVLSIP